MNAKTITTADLARLFDTTAKTIADLGKRNILVKGKKRGSWLLWDSVTCYVKHLRGEAAVETDAVEKLWTSKLSAFRNRILGIPGRVQYLSARQTVVLQQELRAALDELAEDTTAQRVRRLGTRGGAGVDD